MLRFNHLIFFGPTGTAQWKGNIYGAPRFTWLINKPVVYHGVFGHGLFQSIYPTPRSVVADYVSSIEWFVLTLFVFALAMPLEKLRIVPFLMFGATFLVALSYMIHARLEARFDTIPARILVMILAFAQPLVRGWARYSTWHRFKRTPGSVIMAPHAHEHTPARWLNMTNRRYWNEGGVGREELLTTIIGALETEGWRYSTDTGWKNWDIQIYGNMWWNLRLRTVTEYHGGPKCLTRVKLTYSPVFTTVLINLILAPVMIYRQVFAHTRLHDYWALVLYAFFLLFICYRGFRLKLRVADLVDTSALKCDLTRITGKPAKPEKKAATKSPAEPPAAAATAVSMQSGGDDVQAAGTATTVSPQGMVPPQPQTAVSPQPQTPVSPQPAPVS